MTDSPPEPSPWPAPQPWTAPRIAEFLARTFIHPDQVVELRALNVGRPGRTVAGYFDGRHLLDLAKTALAVTRQASAVFFTPNPVDPALLSRCPNRTDVVSRDKFNLAKDGDFLERRHLFADVDPVRQHGRSDDPVDEDEYWDGVVCADLLTYWFRTEHNWPRPARMHSGNGVHLLFPLADPLPPKPNVMDADADPLRNYLRLWADRLTDGGELSFHGRAKLDPNTWNACRLLKVPGTRVVKGAESPGTGRTYRTADVLEIPDDWPAPRCPVDRRDPDDRADGGEVPAGSRPAEVRDRGPREEGGGKGSGQPATGRPVPAAAPGGRPPAGWPGGESVGAARRRPRRSRAEGPGLFE